MLKKEEKNPSLNKKEFKIPNTFVILFIILLVVCALTYVVPAGSFERIENDAGRVVVVADSYTQTESSPVSPLSIPMKIFTTLWSSGATQIMFFIFIIGGAFEIIMRTGMISAYCSKIGKVSEKKSKFVIPIFVIIFAICGFTMGMSVEVLVFVPIGIAVAEALGYDRTTGTAMIAMGSVIGFTAGIYNPFNVGVAQSLADLPMFSGAGFRWVVLIVFVIITSAYIIRYAEKVRKNPEKDILYGLDLENANAAEIVEINSRHKFILITVVGGFALLIYGVSKLGWYIDEMAVLFMVMGFLSGFLYGYGPSKVCDIFLEGVSNIAYGALVVGVASAITTIMTDGMIIDTIINALADSVANLPHAVQSSGMFVMQTLINFLINSGSGQATATMPVLLPVGDLIGLSRQVTILAFQFGDGLSNAIFPTSSTMLGFLAASKIPYSKWLRYVMPLMLIIWAACIVLLIAAQSIGY